MRTALVTFFTLCAGLALCAAGPARAEAQVLPGQGSSNTAQQFRAVLNQSNHLRGEHQGQNLGEPVIQTYDMFFFPGGEVLRIVRTRPRNGEGETERKSEWGTYSVDQFDNKISFYFPDSGRRSFPIRVIPARQSVLIGRMALRTVDDSGLAGRGMNSGHGYQIRSINTTAGSDTPITERFGDFSRNYKPTDDGILIATLPESGRYVLLDQGPVEQSGGPDGESSSGNGDTSEGGDGSGTPPRPQSLEVVTTFNVGGTQNLDWQMVDRRYDDEASFNYHPKAAQEQN